MIPRKTIYTVAAILAGFLVYTAYLRGSAVGEAHASDRIATYTATIDTLSHRVDSLKARAPKAETTYVAAKAKSDARATKTTDDAQVAQQAVKATGDSAAIKAVSTLTMDLVLERRERAIERESADSLITLYKDIAGNLSSEIAAVESRADAQHTLDHRVLIRERARGLVTIASASGGAAVGAVFGGPPGAAIGAAAGGLLSYFVGR